MNNSIDEFVIKPQANNSIDEFVIKPAEQAVQQAASQPVPDPSAQDKAPQPQQASPQQDQSAPTTGIIRPQSNPGEHLVKEINAFGGGLSQGINDIAWATQSALIWGASKLDLSDDKTNKLKTARDQLYSEMSPQNEATKEGMAYDPTTSKLAQYGVDIAAGMATGGMGGGSVLGRAGMNGLVGTGSSGGTDAGFAVGAGTSLAGDLLAKGITNGVNYLTTKTRMNNKLAEMNQGLVGQDTNAAAGQSIANNAKEISQTKDSLYQPINESKYLVNAPSISGQAKAIIKNHEKTMTTGQVGVFEDIINRTNKVTTLGELNNLKQFVRAEAKQFYGKNNDPRIVEAFNALKTNLENKVTNVAKTAGLGGQLTTADQFYHDVYRHMDDFGGFDILKAVKGVNPEQANAAYSQQIDGLIDRAFSAKGSPNKLEDLLSAMDTNGKEIVKAHIIKRAVEKVSSIAETADTTPALKALEMYKKSLTGTQGKDIKEALTGAERILSEFKASSNAQTRDTINAFGTVGKIGSQAALGGFAGYQQNGVPGAVAGAVGFMAVGKVLSSMVNNPVGQQTLIKIGTSSKSKELVNQFLKTIAIEKLAK